MIQEYALDPELLASEFHKNTRFFKEAFGPNSIRFLSCFPKRWRNDLLGAFKRSALKDDVLAKKAVTAFADKLLEKAIMRNHAPLAPGTWLDKAEHEHGKNEFYAILADSNPNGSRAVIPWSQVPEDPKWNDPRVCHPRRTASELAAAVEPLLMRSPEIIFVDPYFDIVSAEYRAVFTEYLKCIGKSLLSVRPKITIVTGLKKVWEKGVREPNAQNVAEFVDDCNRLLPGMLPPGCECKIAVLKEISGGMQLHNRFILSKSIVIKYGIGLGSLGDKTRACDDLDVAVYDSGEGPWELYNLQRQPPAFDNVIKPFMVQSDR